MTGSSCGSDDPQPAMWAARAITASWRRARVFMVSSPFPASLCNPHLHPHLATELVRADDRNGDDPGLVDGNAPGELRVHGQALIVEECRLDTHEKVLVRIVLELHLV